MAHPAITSETFNDIAESTVKKYIADVAARLAADSAKPSFDELFGTLKILNAELTVKAIKVIKSLNRQHLNTSNHLVKEYQQIINNSVNVFVKELR
jgi:hypothetical protein